MSRFFLYFVLLFAVSNCMAQKDSVRKYLDCNLQFTTQKNAVYPAMAIHNDDHWKLFAVYPDTLPLLQIWFADAGLTIMDGPYLLYHPKRQKAQAGNFKNGIADGHWQSWYPNGRAKSDGNLVQNHLAGTWKTWYENGQPESEESYQYTAPEARGPSFHESSPALKAQQLLVNVEAAGVQEGPAFTWYNNGNKESVVNYHNDTLSGACAWYRENGKPSSKETYVNGKVTELECYDEEGKYTGASCSILKQPVLIHPMFTALDYIEYELHKEKNKDIRDEGEAEIAFTVTKKGTVENLVINRTTGAALSEHIMKIFRGMPAWSPAFIHNRAVDYPVKLVVPYYRE